VLLVNVLESTMHELNMVWCKAPEVTPKGAALSAKLHPVTLATEPLAEEPSMITVALAPPTLSMLFVKLARPPQEHTKTSSV
jgi:hypothetical protein